MKDSEDTRRGRKEAVLRAMQMLKDEFPLQRAIEGADPALRAAYAKTLSHWTIHGIPPPRDGCPEAEIQALVALDALVVDECGIGCYPFSARDTGIHVHFAGHRVSAPSTLSRSPGW